MGYIFGGQKNGGSMQKYQYFDVPTLDPTKMPSVSPTRMPSVSPTKMPSVSPTDAESKDIVNTDDNAGFSDDWRNIALLVAGIFLLGSCVAIIYLYWKQKKSQSQIDATNVKASMGDDYVSM